MEEKVEMSLERFMDIIEAKADYEIRCDDLEELLDVIFDNTELSYDNELRIDNSYKIMDYLKIKESYRYDRKQAELIDKRLEEK